MSAKRIQVVVDERERAAFRRQARVEGRSLSAWLREAGRDRLRESQRRTCFDDRASLDAFFDRCDQLEGPSREPDWSEHLQVIEESRRQGLKAVSRLDSDESGDGR
jgi:hypothetical protein